jgi:hypothetical protein
MAVQLQPPLAALLEDHERPPSEIDCGLRVAHRLGDPYAL